MVEREEFWRRIAYALFRRAVGKDASATSIRLERAEVDAGQLSRGDFANEEPDHILVRFEKVES